MAVQFIIGRAGSGKTHHCYQQIERTLQTSPAGSQWVLLLVPQQSTYNAERYLACRRGDKAILNVRVVSFETLARELALGEEAQELVVSARGRRMILAQVLRQNAGELRYFKDCATQPHLAARLDTTLMELQTEAVTLEEIEANLGEMARGGAMADKLHDLKLLAGAYERYLGKERIDPVRRLKALVGQIGQSELVARSLVLVDGFAGFNGMQVQLLCALARQAKRLEICLLMDGGAEAWRTLARGVDELSIFARTQRTYVRLRQALEKEPVKIEAPLLLTMPQRMKSAALAAIERQWTSDQPQSVQVADQEVQLVEADDIRQEVTCAARQVRAWQMQGYRLRDIGVLCRDLQPYHEEVARIFAEHGIACFIDQRRRMSHHPLLRYVRGVLMIAARGWRRDRVLELLKTGLCGLGAEDADFLENFALEHGIDGAAWISDENWEYTLPLAQEDQEQQDDARQLNSRADGLRRRLTRPVQEFARQIRQAKAAREQIEKLYELLCHKEHQVRETLGHWAEAAENSGRAELAQEHQQAWNAVTGLLDDAVRLVGEEKLSSSQLGQTLEAGLEELDLALTPPTLDQVVVGQVDRSRSPEFRAVIVLGLNEGIFPANFNEDAVFSDQERRLLLERNVLLNVDSSRQALDEGLLGYIALTRAAERLVLLRPKADTKGRAASPSMFLSQLERIIKPLPRAGAMGVLEGIVTPAQLGRELAREARRSQTEPSNPASTELAELLAWAQGPAAKTEIRDALREILGSRLYDNSASFQEMHWQEMIHSPLYSSVSRLESYAACPFQHFARYALRLEKREVAEISNLDLGNAFHAVLEQLTREIVQKSGTWGEVTEKRIDDLADQVAKELHHQLLLSTARDRYLLTRIKQTLRRVLRDQRIMEEAGQFRPLDAEVAFGMDGGKMGPLEIKTPKGAELRLRGRIDRVDYVERNLLCAVYDYKTGGKELKLAEVVNGLTLQLLTYLLVLDQQGEKLQKGKLTPVGAFYLQLLRQVDTGRVPAEALPENEVEAKPEGIFSAEAQAYFDHTLEPGNKSRILDIKQNKDGSTKNNKTAQEKEAFSRLLEFLRGKLGEIADEILTGKIEVAPYKLGKKTPCSYCDYRPVCRFDPLINRYHHIDPQKELIAEIAGKQEEDDGR